MPQLVLT